MASADRNSGALKRDASSERNNSDEKSPDQVASHQDERSSAGSSPRLNDSEIKSDRSSPASALGSHEPVETVSVKTEAADLNGHVSPKRTVPRPPKSGRSSLNKIPPRVAPLFDSLPDATGEANGSYAVIETCTYQNKYLGYTEHAMECDCSEEWDSATKTNHACGEDSDCINRATKMECVGDCACGPDCQNQRFRRRLYANVSVIKTEKKGYGLRTNVNLKQGDFVFEYIGEVIAEGAFRRRMIQYDDEGIKHFYFMSLSKGEFVDATRKGNLGRFCNHSCNPNCYVDKWVVGDKLRMGIFAERAIKAGEELVFNYNVDRYGANPQPCYCGESNCTGFIGGKTQTERATKLSAATIEALGIEDDLDTWDTVVAKRPKKKKTAEDDEEYVDSIEAKRLDADGVTKVMAALMQCKEKWIAVRLLQRLQSSDDDDVRHRIVKLHGYKIMNSQLSAWRDDENIVFQILEILDSFPRLTRNKIVDAKIDKTLEPLSKHLDERVQKKAQHLLDVWSQLELAYRIPRKQRDPAGSTNRSDVVKFERRESAQQRKRSRSRSRSKSPPKGPSAALPSGPRLLQRPGGFASRPGPSAFPRGPLSLPKGWFQAQDEKNRPYFYTSTGKRQWARPTQPEELPAPSLKQASHQDDLNSIINKIVEGKEKERGAKTATPDTPDPSKKEKKPEKWRTYDEEKQKKLYENTLFPHISHVMSRYKHKIPKDDLKRFGKEAAKKLVNSDYKAGRVKDPTVIDAKHQKKVKGFCKEFFDKAAAKHKKHEEERAARKAKKPGTASLSTNGTPAQSPIVTAEDTPIKGEMSDGEDIKMSDHEDNSAASPSPAQSNGGLKRKRESPTDLDSLKHEDDSLTASPAKKLNTQYDSDAGSPPPPPPPPAPPIDTPQDANTPETNTDTDIHADTSFKSRSMADVLAQAQQEGEEEEDDDDKDMTDLPPVKAEGTKFEEAILGNDGAKMENPMVEGQEIIQKIKDEGHER